MKYITILFSLLVTTLSLQAQMSGPQLRTDYLNITDNHIAMDGYDPVSYFVSAEPKKGNSDISISREGVTYYFSSEENLGRFKKDPGKYEPAYGGWCAYAMGKDGSRVKVDPETFKIIDGKVYLFYHTFFVNTLPKWDENESRLKAEADKNWEKIISDNQ